MTNTIQLTTEEMALYGKFKAQMEADETYQRNMRDVWKRVKARFKDEFNKFDWVEIHDSIRPWDGSHSHIEYSHNESFKVQQSIGQLVRATLKVKGTRNISDEDEHKVEAITKQIIAFLLSFREDISA